MWQPVLDSIKARLSSWRSSKLSIGGRVTLINSVLSSLPLYLFSMFKAPKKVINEIQRMQRRFLWGGNEDRRKLAWVKWDLVCKPKYKGGLGVKDLEVFNVALLAKWRWRLLLEDDPPLWKKVLYTRYGLINSWTDELSTAAVSRKFSLWWRDLLVLGNGIRLGRNWFNDVCKLRIGNGTRVKFWTDVWLGRESLAALFPSLFDASERMECTVAEMGSWDASGGRWNWDWVALAAGVEPEAVRELQVLLTDLQLQQNASDRWVWLPDLICGFTVKSCYEWIRNYVQGSASGLVDSAADACRVLWKNDLPSKVLIFSWRLLLNKLPTRENLNIRGVLTSNFDLSCVFCFGEVETVEHIFCQCYFVLAVWRGIFGWLDIDGDVETDVIDSFHQVSKLVVGKKARRLHHIFWVATTWQIWLARNRKIFKGGVANVNSIVNSIKYVSWSWFIARKGRNSGVNYADWYNCPLGCLSSL